MIPLRPTAQTSQSHAPTHATGGTDPLTPAAIGAAAATHTHTGSQISGNISGNAANVTGVVAIANGGTGAVNAAAALTNLGAAPTSHTHTGSQISGNISGNAANVTGVVAIANGGTGASTAAAARTNLGVAATNHNHIPGYYAFTGLQPGWAQYSSTYSCRFWLSNGLVALNGLVTRVSGTSNLIYQLAVNTVPYSQRIFVALGSFNGAYTVFRIDILTSGEVKVIHPNITTGTVDWISLDNIAFFVA